MLKTTCVNCARLWTRRYKISVYAAENFGDRVRLAEGEELLAREFGSVTRHDFESELIMTDLAPLEAYLMSSINTAGLPEEGREDYVRRVLSHLSPGPQGVVRLTTHPGCLVCS